MAYTFSEDFLNTLRLRSDIETVISRYTELKKSGGSLIGLCPFHNEKTPSFHVNSAKQLFYCFGCNAGGDVISFAMKIENLSYVDAVTFLAEQAGIKLPQNNSLDNELSFLRNKILEMNKVAARFFYENLMSESGRQALEYFTERGLTQRTITHFGLGYSLNSWDDLLKHLIEKGYSKENIKASGLVSSNEKNMFDRFRNRVMFPIIDSRNNIIGFGGRAMEDDPAKYLNTSETVAFKKGNNIYAINFAKNTKAGEFILCEGYMDVITMHQAGFTNAIATLGTALTVDQARLIKRCTNNITICYDGDQAGKNATKRAIEILENEDISIKVITVTGAKDPDEFIKKYGAKKFQALLDGSLNRLDYKLNEVKFKYNLDIDSERVQCLKMMIGILAAIRSKIEQEIYIDKISKDLNVSKDSIQAEITEYKRKIEKLKQIMEEKKVLDKLKGLDDKLNPQRSKNLKATTAEDDIIAILLNFPSNLDMIMIKLTPDDFITDFNRRIYIILTQKMKENPTIEPIMLVSQEFNSEEIGKLTSYIKETNSFNVDEKRINEVIRILKEEKEKLMEKSVSSESDESFLSSINRLKNKKGVTNSGK
ncbi:MAG: primase [Clostridia bacterium]|nr:primase [Clostridia bacterium]